MSKEILRFLWFERVVKPRLRGEAYLVRYIDDFVLCFQYLRASASRRCECIATDVGSVAVICRAICSSSGMPVTKRTVESPPDAPPKLGDR